jgi:hypothetical protein
MMTQKFREFVERLFGPVRVTTLLILVIIIYLLPFNSKSEFIQQNRQIVEINQVSPILKSIYPEEAYATCGDGGTGTNCQTGCCSAGACVVCPPGPDDQPPSISANLNCSNPGNDNWCIGTLSIDLSASDPQGAGLFISGILNGNNFTCPITATSCSFPIAQEGLGAIAYRVDAATGLSASGAVSYKLDATTPVLNGSINGVPGANNWYRSNVTLTISASDALSGLAAIMSSVNGGSSSAVNAPLSFGDGISNVVISATDNAGNVTQMTQSIQVDTITPSLSTSLSGTSGANGWYVSTVTITPSAGDAGSGLASFEVSIDGNAYTAYTAPITFSDGIHTYQFRATDNAGNLTETVLQTVKVDTTTPTIGLNVAGTKGSNGWYVSLVKVTPNVSDATSTVGLIEAIVDNGPWSVINSPLSFTDGLHTYQFKVTDQAGNFTTIPLQNLKIDTITPAIDMTAEASLGDAVYYSLEDQGSGLSLYRAVIEDEDEQYQKIVWLDVISGNKLEDQILWDGKFRDGTQAGWGEYFITLKISDAAGNETMKSAVVTVNPFSFLQELPTFTPPENTSGDEIAQAAQTDDSPATQFGGENNNNPASEEVITTNEGGAGMTWPQEIIGEASFSVPSTTTSNSTPMNPNILWGVAATALAGAALAEWERQREEERKRQEAEEAMQQKRENTEKRQAQKAQEDAVRERWAEEAAEEERRERANNASTARWEGLAQIEQAKEQARINSADTARWNGLAALAQAEERARVNSADTARWNGLAALAQEKQEEENKPTFLDKAWNWAYNNQTDLSLGTGVVVGAVAAGLFITTVVTSPLWLIVGAVVLTAAIVTAGTVALNNHFNQNWDNNLLSNLITGTTAAAFISGVGMLLAPALPWISTTVTGLCTQYATVCNQIGTVVDYGEQALLSSQIAYYNWVGNQDAAAAATIELQLELQDGGVPGNAITLEMSQQLAKLGPDAMELVSKYGADVVPFLIKYGDDAMDIVGAYGDEGLSLLLLYGDDAVKIIKEYGTPGVDLMTTYGDDAFELMTTYGDEAIGFVNNAKILGVNPIDILENPPKSGQSLNGWLLKIDDLNNPVNKKTNLNLSESRIKDLVELSIHTGKNEDLFVLGFYDKNHVNGYLEVADKLDATYFSMDDDLYTETGFSSATGDFWQVNQKAVMDAVGERKTFVLSTKYTEIQRNTSKSTWAEMQLILSDGNNYKLVEGVGDEYDRLVPVELLQ